MQFSSLTYKNRLRSKIQLNQSALCYPKLSKWIFRKDSIHHTTCSYLLLFNKGKKLYQNYLKPWNFAWALLKTQYLCNRNFLNVCLDDEKWHNSKRLWFMDRCNFSNVASPRLIYIYSKCKCCNNFLFSRCSISLALFTQVFFFTKKETVTNSVLATSFLTFLGSLRHLAY